MLDTTKKLAVITGASTGIGFELARQCAQNGFGLIISADEREIERAAEVLRAEGASVETVEADLATMEGVDKLVAQIGARPVDALLANAGRGLGKAFLDQDFDEVRRVVDTNITGTIYLIQKIGRAMRSRGEGRILITGSIAGFLPGTYQAVYNGAKAFLDSFSFAIRAELKGSGVTVTCLMPGATETDFFERADMLDTKVGREKKADPADVARTGFKAMMNGDGDVVAGCRISCNQPSRRSRHQPCWLSNTERWRSQIPQKPNLARCRLLIVFHLDVAVAGARSGDDDARTRRDSDRTARISVRRANRDGHSIPTARAACLCGDFTVASRDVGRQPAGA